jgi:hypothetical protein
MSNILDTKGVIMSFEEKMTWVGAAVSVIVAAVYYSIIGSRAGGTPVEDIAYKWPLIIAICAMVGLTIVGTIVVSIVTAIAAQIKGEGSIDDIDRKDERDVRIGWRGDRASFYVTSAVMIAVLVLAMLETPHFWIANAVFASFFIAGLASSTVKLVAYRRGF